MTPEDTLPDTKPITRARVNRLPTEENSLEDMPFEVDQENIVIEGRLPDLGEIEEDASEL
jgi:hypothetical protein